MTAARIATNSAGILLAGLLAATIAIAAPSVGNKPLLLGIAALGVVWLAVLSQYRTEIFLAAFLLALTYNREFYTFAGLVGEDGYPGPAWIAADPCLILLMLSGLGRRTESGRPPSTQPTALLAIPFCAACLLSAAASNRPDWAFWESLRVVKFIVLLVWLRRNMSPRLWTAAAAALGCSIVLQSTLGTLQVATHGGTSMLAMFGLHSDAPKNVFEIENRARGTLGHPNFLAPYLLMLVPGAFGGALFAGHLPVRLACLLVTGCGLVGLVLTASRFPIVLGAGTLVALAIYAVWSGVLPLRTALAGGVAASAVLGIVALSFAEAISKRLFDDIGGGIDFREEFNNVALMLWDQAPMLGIGLNNSMAELLRQPDLYDRIALGLNTFRDMPGVRPPSVHNVYVLIISETGVLGLATFLFLLGSILRVGIVAAPRCNGAAKGICAGLTMALLPQYLQQILDFSLWGDASWFTLATIAALLGTAPQQAPRSS